MSFALPTITVSITAGEKLAFSDFLGFLRFLGFKVFLVYLSFFIGLIYEA